VRAPKTNSKRLTRVCAALVLGLMSLPNTALAQAPEVTPNFSVTPTKTVTPWVYQMAVGAVVVAALILIFLLVSYLRFSPKFFGREQPAQAVPPGTRPPLLQRAPRPAPTVSAGSAAPAPASAAAPSTAPVATATATAVAERPAPSVSRPTEGEAATQADAVGQAEPAAPAPAQAPPAAAPSPAPAQPGSSPAESALDQETFDRVLKEQLDKGMDRRVAEGRARAAAVVAARKKAQR
jgi:hypothetical protein